MSPAWVEVSKLIGALKSEFHFKLSALCQTPGGRPEVSWVKSRGSVWVIGTADHYHYFGFRIGVPTYTYWHISH